MNLPGPRSLVAALALAFAALGSFACNSADGETVTVFAAASLTDAFTEMSTAFELENPGTDIELAFGSSSALAVQVIEGAPADVFASANHQQMAVVVENGSAQTPRVFATNQLAVVVPGGSTKVETFADLAIPGVLLVLAAPEVPAGQFARQSFEQASEQPGFGKDFAERVLANVVSNETDVRAVLTKVQLGEADAGIVYTTDAAAAGADVDVLSIPANANIVAEYPIVALSDAANSAGAASFVDFVFSERGQSILARHGFGPPR